VRTRRRGGAGLTRLVLCRHACPGDVAEAAQLADALRDRPLAAVYTSPIERAAVTAQAVAAAHRLEPIVVDELRELDFGEADGVPFEELPPELQRALVENPTEVRFPGGESYAELRERVTVACDQIVTLHPGSEVVVVSHAGAIRAALATWLSMADGAAFRLDQRYASINIVDWTDGTPFVRVVNAAAAPLSTRVG
jgi:alpha-ribazole phosphatase